MNVLFPLVGDSVGGSHWSVINLFKELQKKQSINPKIVLHVSNGKLSKHLDDMNIPYDVFHFKTLAGQNSNLISILFFMLYHAYSIVKYIKSNDVDIVHGNDLRINLTWSLPVKLSSAKYIWHQRTHLSNSVKWKAIRYLANHVVSISSYVHNSLPSNLTKEMKSHIKNPFDIKITYNKKKARRDININYPFLKDVFLIGYVGRLVPWKRVENILYALQEINPRVNKECNIYFVIVGEGEKRYTDKINSLIKSLKLSDYVSTLGFFRRPSKLLSALDLLITSSHNEPFGRVVIESMIQKTPVLASKSGGHIETIIHNKTGLLYNEDQSSNSLSRYIYSIAMGGVDTMPIVDFAYSKVIVEYSATNHANKIIDIYKGLF
jgi:glycosyltransferase involved in cell wall biosynthesis